MIIVCQVFSSINWASSCRLRARSRWTHDHRCAIDIVSKCLSRRRAIYDKFWLNPKSKMAKLLCTKRAKIIEGSLRLHGAQDVLITGLALKMVLLLFQGEIRFCLVWTTDGITIIYPGRCRFRIHLGSVWLDPYSMGAWCVVSGKRRSVHSSLKGKSSVTLQLLYMVSLLPWLCINIRYECQCGHVTAIYLPWNKEKIDM